MLRRTSKFRWECITSPTGMVIFKFHPSLNIDSPWVKSRLEEFRNDYIIGGYSRDSNDLTICLRPRKK